MSPQQTEKNLDTYVAVELPVPSAPQILNRLMLQIAREHGHGNVPATREEGEILRSAYGYIPLGGSQENISVSSVEVAEMVFRHLGLQDLLKQQKILGVSESEQYNTSVDSSPKDDSDTRIPGISPSDVHLGLVLHLWKIDHPDQVWDKDIRRLFPYFNRARRGARGPISGRKDMVTEMLPQVSPPEEVLQQTKSKLVLFASEKFSRESGPKLYMKIIEYWIEKCLERLYSQPPETKRILFDSYELDNDAVWRFEEFVDDSSDIFAVSISAGEVIRYRDRFRSLLKRILEKSQRVLSLDMVSHWFQETPSIRRNALASDMTQLEGLVFAKVVYNDSKENTDLLKVLEAFFEE